MTKITMDSIDSPSFNSHSSNTIAEAADRVINELLVNNDHGFSFSDSDTLNTEDNPNVNTNEVDETPTSITITADNNNNVISNTQNVKEDEIEFEFPIDEHISPRFPLFDRTLLLDHETNSKPAPASAPTPVYHETNSKSAQAPTLTPVHHETNSKPAQASAITPVRFSLGKLLIEARDQSGSCSSSDADDLDGITPDTYCVWKPNESPREKNGKHKKSNSVSIGNSSKRWNVRDLLKRSFSDDNYTITGNVSPVIVFSPPISPKPKVKGDSSSEVVTKTKMVKKNPAYKGKIGNIRVPAYYPYRQDQIGVFGNANGSSKNLFRY